MVFAEREIVDLLRAALSVEARASPCRPVQRDRSAWISRRWTACETDLGPVAGGKRPLIAATPLRGLRPAGEQLAPDLGGDVVRAGARGKGGRSCRVTVSPTATRPGRAHHGVDAELWCGPTLPLSPAARVLVSRAPWYRGRPQSRRSARWARSPPARPRRCAGLADLGRNPPTGGKPVEPEIGGKRRGSRSWPSFCVSARSEATLQQRHRGEGRILHAGGREPDQRGPAAPPGGVDRPDPGKAPVRPRAFRVDRQVGPIGMRQVGHLSPPRPTCGHAISDAPLARRRSCDRDASVRASPPSSCTDQGAVQP